jgi:hypothetical protein
VNETWAMLLKEGGAIAALIVLFYILKLLVPLLQRPRENGKTSGNGHSGQQPISFWKTEIRDAVKQVLVDNAPQRHQDLEKLMEEVIEREFRKRDKVLRELIREELRGLK